MEVEYRLWRGRLMEVFRSVSKNVGEHSAVPFTLLQPSVENNRLVQVIGYSLEANQSHNRLLGATSVEGPVGPLV